TGRAKTTWFATARGRCRATWRSRLAEHGRDRGARTALRAPGTILGGLPAGLRPQPQASAVLADDPARRVFLVGAVTGSRLDRLGRRARRRHQGLDHVGVRALPAHDPDGLDHLLVL